MDLEPSLGEAPSLIHSTPSSPIFHKLAFTIGVQVVIPSGDTSTKAQFPICLILRFIRFDALHSTE